MAQSTQIARTTQLVSTVSFVRLPELFSISVVASALNPKSTRDTLDDFESGDGFILDDSSWILIQLYAQAAVQLPTTLGALQEKFGKNIQSALGSSLCNYLLDSWSTAKGHCSKYLEQTLPKVVGTGQSTFEYAMSMRTLYPEMDQSFAILFSDASPSMKDTAARELQVRCKYIIILTNQRSAETAIVAKEVNDFYVDASADRERARDVAERVDKIDDTTDSKLYRLREEITEKRRIMDEANAEYEHWRQVAKDTAAYVWIPIFGWIAGPAVAADANNKANAALKEYREASAELEDLNADLKNATEMKNSIEKAVTQASLITNMSVEALTGLATMNSAWLRISNDFEDISAKLDRWQDNLDYLALLDFDTMKQKWAEIAALAAGYINRAYINMLSESEAKDLFANFSWKKVEAVNK